MIPGATLAADGQASVRVKGQCQVDPATTSDEQERFWNDVAGPLWVTLEEETERHTAPFGDIALAAATPGHGQRVLDVGCGCGSTTVALGHAVGAAGAVVGADVSTVMLEQAARRVRTAGLRNVTLRNVDAQTADLGSGGFDLVFSRFGVMFFTDATAAFANLRRALRSGGRLVFTCWQQPSANLWMALPGRAALKLFDLTPPPHDAPGPFSLADPARVTAVLTAAGFGSINVQPHRLPLEFAVGVSVREWVHQRLLMGPAREKYLASDEQRQCEARAVLSDAVAPYRAGDRLRIDGAAWLVTADR